ncbi:secernin [Mycobacterium frederiksbergense]|uniref:Dipeptidase n=1 Tax=Mycolicibacterium frederiksbergense TaxID=117567 RepID=A0ABT6L6U1_9MYCO|nr:C69 family dipeptidase [Mycolicibacterium frederiksbergense]MDH6198674.1 secernin [Mycolicibacterium frederiksbergense]
MIQRPWSCDTFVALPDSTRNGALIFGKNSDRPAGEAQPLRRIPARPAGSPLRLAYVTLDDADAYAHVGSAPFWCWGHEIGVNEHRVAIGNEAVFSRPWSAAVAADRDGRGPQPGLLGMELVRLGLERGATAHEALLVMTQLLERYGQWGSAIVGKDHGSGAYDNSYLIADPTEAWVLETVGSEWAARRVSSGSYAISNELTIRTEPDAASDGLRRHAVEAGWYPADRDFDVADAYTDPGTPLQVSHIRRRRADDLLAAARSGGALDVAQGFAVLRDHLEGTFLGGPMFDASRPDFLTLCMHEHPAGFTWGNTAASLVVELHDDPERPVALWWCPVTPCTGIYVPYFVEAGRLPDNVQRPDPLVDSWDPRDHSAATYDPTSTWWQWQQLLDVVKDPGERDFPRRAAAVREAFDELENRWLTAVPKLAAAPEELAAFTDDCLSAATRTAIELIERFGANPHTPVDPRWAPSMSA